MKYAALASGSNGNCYYVGHGDDAILIDVGVSAKQVEQRMRNLGVLPGSIKAVFITHEHTDHIRGLAVFCKRNQVPVYLTEGTYKGAAIQLPSSLLRIIKPNESVSIGCLRVTGVPKYHDACEPCSFTISDGVHNLGLLTDIGRVCEQVERVIRQSDVLLLEANYDEALLENGGYPFFLKQRIRGGSGHLSNQLALDAVLRFKSSKLRHLILGHLSGKNNTVALVEAMFVPHCQDIRLSVAGREKETALFDTKNCPTLLLV